jgi:hypothetical protein
VAQWIAQFISRALVATTPLLFVLATDLSAAAVGKVTEQTGPTEIQRDKAVIESAKDSAVEMQDAVVTANAKVGITFDDSSTVKITEQSKLVIDTFVFDPAKGDASKVGLKLAMGTARFASGQIAKNNPQAVNIETPTAQVGVRGTDFSMTVDEIGRSLVILLPSCPVGYKDIEKDCKTGQIFVKTDTGVVHLTKPFQSTTTQSKEANPSKPNILQLTEAQISNMLILTKPKHEPTLEELKRNILDINALDKDLLRFDALNVDLLAESTERLGQNYLNDSFLANILDLMNAGLLDNQLNNTDPDFLPKYKPNKAFGLKYYVEDQNVTLYKQAPASYAQVTVDKDSATVVNIKQDGINVSQTVNRQGSSTVNIVQSR